ncbi:hypothetical protein BV372_29130 [Nostoc sp. T09]|uniref:hypothetical protein n=1 Tax=Nostoc sp. T09 TaxID=1932621 RepID=UPI000A37B817|nr:hypothetical protein [Nostoc sp. T09]OUL24093.1 hypothetical protein BV372_29130 [Nostoc sp. T09]
MEHWQFLIQRQGDRAWHTLESPKVEILEGRYRVLARSNRPNTDVEVRVTHSSTQEIPPKRRVQKRSRRTNSEGLMAVIPYTYFKPGIWELQCSGDLMSDILGKSWQYNAYLRVLPQYADGEVKTSGDGDNIESDLSYDLDTISDGDLAFAVPVESTTALETTVTEDSKLAIVAHSSSTTTEALVDVLEEEIIDQPVSPVWVKGETAEQILQNLIDLALPTSEPLLDDEMLENPPATQALPPLLLNLDRETYVAQWGQALTINGRVELQPKADLEVEIPYLESLYSLELRIYLRSPLELEILNQVRQPLSNEVLPFTIKSSIDIPAGCESKLILADISLYGALTDVGEVTLLASHAFTITADVSELLAIRAALTPNTPELVDNQSTTMTSDVSQAPESSGILDLSLLNLVKAVKPDQSLLLSPSENKFLPPQIKPRSRKKSLDSHRGLDLPNMPPLPSVKTAATALLAESSTSEPTKAELATQEEDLEKVETFAAIDMDQLVIKNRRASMIGSTFPYLKPLTDLPSDGEAVNRDVSDASDSQRPENSKALDITLGGFDKTTELLINNQESQDESVAEVAVSRRSKLIDAYLAEVATPPRPELIDEFVAQTATPPSSELIDESVVLTVTPPTPELIDEPVVPTATSPHPKLIVEGNPYSSPLITKWLQNQGFSLPEPIYLQNQDYDTDLVEPQTNPNQQARVAHNPETPSVELHLPLNLDAEMEIPTDWLAIAQQELETAENLSKEYSTPSLPEPPPPPPRYPKIPLPRFAEEIVVDDIYIEPEVDIPESLTVEEEVPAVPIVAEPSRLQLMTAAIVEPLPTPKLHVPEGELIAGTSVRVRVELPQVSSEVVIKLWIEDCQTRWLMDGPHLLKNLQMNSLAELEVTTQLHIPFGCLEMRVEAIALDPQTQQESHKVTITRTVIPPDLPTLQLDELLGI